MVLEPDQEEVLVPAEDEEYGGPVKPFLEHLEDLRWTLIKVVVAVAIGMLVSLIAANNLVSFLTFPLRKAEISLPKHKRVVPVYFGTNILSRVSVSGFTNYFGTNRVIAGFDMAPVSVGTNNLLSLQPRIAEDPNDANIAEINLKNYSPIEAFIIAFKLALYGGLVLSAPLVIYFIGDFVLPAMKVSEKNLLFQIVGFGSLLFFAGVAFCYFIIMQVALLATVQFSNWLGFSADEWRADSYISFVCKFMLGMGISFQLPVVLLTMVKIGILDHENLRKFRAYWIVINMVICAFATPSGDPLTMLLMAVPLQILYEMSVFIARYWKRKEAASLDGITD